MWSNSEEQFPGVWKLEADEKKIVIGTLGDDGTVPFGDTENIPYWGIFHWILPQKPPLHTEH